MHDWINFFSLACVKAGKARDGIGAPPYYCSYPNF